MTFLLLLYLILIYYGSEYYIRNLEDKNNTLKILLFTFIGLLVLIIILFIFYKFFLNYYINSRNILSFNNNNKNTLKKHYIFQKILDFYIYDSEDEEVCPICIQKFNKNISKVCKTPCNHIFYQLFYFILIKFIII